MSEKIFRGKISFINNKTNKVSIEYITGNKIKSIQAIVDDVHQERWMEQKLIKKPHRFLIGDNVKFIIKKSSVGVFFADQVVFEFNNALEVVIQKARVENKFSGYVKVVDDKHFIKEIDSYLFFPLQLSRFEIPPPATETGKPIIFKLLHIDKPERIAAELYNHKYLPGFTQLLKQYKSEMPVDAMVTKISPYGVFVVLSESQMEAKLSIDDAITAKINSGDIAPEKTIQVKIKHITGDRIVIENV